MEILKKKIIDGFAFLYKRFLIRKATLRLNQLLFELSLTGLGILNHKNDEVSGEAFFLKQISTILHNSVVLDIGAHVGDYANKVRNLSASAKIYAFEPHPETFKQLEYQALRNHYTALNLACSDTDGKLNLYDYCGARSASQHASLYQSVFTDLHKGDTQKWEVSVRTIDQLSEQYGIDRIKLLKIDTEGNEFNVLLGSKRMLDDNLIDVIQFEFNEMNVISRVFFRDFYILLKNYAFFRLLPDGLLPLGDYSPFTCEIYAYQNIIAINNGYLSTIREHLNV